MPKAHQAELNDLRNRALKIAEHIEAEHRPRANTLTRSTYRSRQRACRALSRITFGPCYREPENLIRRRSRNW